MRKKTNKTFSNENKSVDEAVSTVNHDAAYVVESSSTKQNQNMFLFNTNIEV